MLQWASRTVRVRSSARHQFNGQIGTATAPQRLHQQDFLTQLLSVDIEQCDLLENHWFTGLHRDKPARESATIVSFGTVPRKSNGPRLLSLQLRLRAKILQTASGYRYITHRIEYGPVVLGDQRI